MKNQEKPTIVFIHYFGGDGGSWQWMAKRLPKKQDCVFLTLPGFGGIEPLKKPTIRAFSEWIIAQLDDMNIDRYILCGHSMGGKLALFTAFTATEHPPEKIILIAPSPPTTEAMPSAEKKRMLNHPNKLEAVTTVNNAIAKKLKKNRFDYAVESQLIIDENTWEWWIKTGMNNDVSWATTGLDLPVHVICSANDPVITLDSINNEVLPNLKNVRLITFGKSGHLIPMESPRKLARHLKRIVKD